MKKKLFQILMLSAAVWLVPPAEAHASTITIQKAYGPLVHGRLFQFGEGIDAYELRLVFDVVATPFTVDVTADDNPNLSILPPGYVCVPINGGNNCIMFTVTPSSVGWIGSYTVTIAWQADTTGQYPNEPLDSSGLGRVRILHFDSSGLSDITTPNSYCTTCGVDPAIGGRDDNFSDFIVVQAAVPEPATMVLLGSGLVVLAMRLRRRRRSS